MKTATLGKDGLKVSALGIGLMGIGGIYGRRDEAQSIAAIERALELGVTHFDTADVYGASEDIIGRAMKGRFGRIQIATKCGLVGVGVDGSPAHIKRSCETSLRRLGTDVIDLYYLHRPDPKVPIEESVGAFADLRREGKIRHVGLSEFNPEQLRRAAKVTPIAALQSEYSLFVRGIEDQVLGVCRELGIGLVAFSPLGRGLLTGKIRSAGDLSVGGDRRSKMMPQLRGDNLEANLRLVAEVEAVAREVGATTTQVALAWLMAQGDDIVPIPGSSSVATLEENVGALSVSLTQAQMQRLDPLAGRVQGDRRPDLSALTDN